MICPFSERKDGDKIRRKYLGPQHLTGKYDCFTYSPNQNGVFCVPCVIFGSRAAGRNTLDRLVRSPLKNYCHLTGRDGYLTAHLSKAYHQESCFKAKQLKKTAESSDVYSQLNKAAAEERLKNRKILDRILEAIVFLGRRGLPMRAHRDSGSLCPNDICFDEGNFRALLQLMISCGDDILKQHVETCKKNASYISWSSQNDLIQAIGVVLTEDIVVEVNKSRFFTLMADETTDASGQEQLSICLRTYVAPDDSI